METNDFNVAMTKPGSAGEMPLPKRQGAKTMVPLSWLGREVAVSYVNGHGNDVSTAKGALVDWCPLGLILTIKGVRTIVSHDRLVLLELVND